MTAAACKSAKERSLTFKMNFGSQRGRHLQFVSKRTTAVAASHFVETTSPSLRDRLMSYLNLSNRKGPLPHFSEVHFVPSPLRKCKDPSDQNLRMLPFGSTKGPWMHLLLASEGGLNLIRPPLRSVSFTWDVYEGGDDAVRCVRRVAHLYRGVLVTGLDAWIAKRE
ncbi:MAG: hypothetical protein ACTS7I_02555, partial [Candidatus Hodgkinia cicadicola]